jgi:hypothetical protein
MDKKEMLIMLGGIALSLIIVSLTIYFRSGVF